MAPFDRLYRTPYDYVIASAALSTTIFESLHVEKKFEFDVNQGH